MALDITGKVGWWSGSVNAAPAASYLLDTYTGADAAYSLRKLRTAYTGNAITVRRSSDNTSQQIGFDANGNLDTTTLLSFVGAGNGFVSTWFDQSGNGRDTIQATAANQPQIVVNGALNTVNSKPAIKWSSSSTLALASTLNLTTQIYFVVNKNDNNLTSSSTYQVISTGDASGTMSTAIYSYGSVTTQLPGEAISNIANISGFVYGVGNGNTVVANQHLNNFKYLSDGSTEIWLDNTILSLSIAGSDTRPYSNTTTGNYPRTFNRIGNNSARTNGLVGSFQEFIIYPSDMNITNVNTNINSFYSIY